MKEFKYKGAIVKPYEPFFYGMSEKFFHGSLGGVARTLLAEGVQQVVIIEIDEETDIIKPR